MTKRRRGRISFFRHWPNLGLRSKAAAAAKRSKGWPGFDKKSQAATVTFILENNMPFSLRTVLGCAVLAGAMVARADDFQGATHIMPFDEDTIAYSKTKSTGPVAKLQERMDKGEVQLKRDADYGYLLSILEALGVKKSSQMLVFSKTSFQRERIDPKHPRAIFLGDDVYVGFIPGSPLIEVSEADPKLGGVFYSFDQSQPRPHFARNDQCLECHASAKTMGVPGHLSG